MQPLFKMFGNVQLVQELTSQDEKKNRTAFLDLQTQSATSKVRKSRYTVRHYRRQPSISFKRNHITNKTNNTPEEESNENNGIKSQKLLCLWPLPIVTRYMILVSLLVTAVDRLFGAFACSAPSFVLYRWDVMNLVASPFLIHQDLSGYFLFCWNVLILGLFEESVAPMVGGTKKFIQLLSTLFALVSVSRVVMGFIFSKSTGWAFPLLFFSNAMHECNKGFAPFLFALLVVQSLSIDDKYILIYGSKQQEKLTIHKVLLQLLMLMVNYTTTNILWWSVAGLFTGLIVTVILQILLAEKKRHDAELVKDVHDFLTLEQYRRTPLWRLVWSCIKASSTVVAVTWMLLFVFNQYYITQPNVTATQLNTIPASIGDDYLFTFVFMTAPRRGDPDYLTRTISSYLENWPENPSSASPYARMQAIIYTHFTNHSEYDAAQHYFSSTVKGQRYLRWVRENGDELNQRLHVSKALQLVQDSYKSTYYALMEDDFPVCGRKEWQEIENTIYRAQEIDHCGVFVGTGGSGLFLKPDVTKLITSRLLQDINMPPDIVIQDCLLGKLPECQHCQIVTSKRLLMYHIGYNASTSEDRSYRKDEFQCGWRHPFNGDPSVMTL